MKFIFILALAAVIFAAYKHPSSKEAGLYIGHSAYQAGNKRICIVRPIYAISKKEADSLFLANTDSSMKADGGVLLKGNYDVWKIESSMILKKENNDTDRRY